MPGPRFAFSILLLTATTTATAQTTPLHVTIAAPDHLDGNFNATVEYAVENTGNADLNDVRLEIREGNQSIILSWAGPTWSCTPGPPPLSAGVMRCTAATLAAGSTAHIGVVHHFLKPYVRTFINAFATIGSASSGALATLDARFFHDFPVTTTADSGPGSLRQAIDDVNAHCLIPDGNNPADPCRITFAIADPPQPGGWFTIEPESPLPEMDATDLTVDGEMQTAIADSNPLGPELFLLGDRAGVIDGLRFRVSRLLLRGLAVGGFAQNGVLVQGGGAIRNNYLGIDPTGRVAVPNGLRGLMSSAGLEVTGNVISGNRRSGIFFAGQGASGALVTNNRIGVAAASDDPVPNGASGIFFGEFSRPSVVAGNVIGNSGDFGIAVARTSGVGATHNRIFNSGQGAIDNGLDGPTRDSYTPSITSARYDPTTQTTTISGTTFTRGPGFTTVELYANGSVDALGFAEAEDYLGSVKVVPEDVSFTLTVPRDLRGLFIDGVAVIQIDPTDFGEDPRQVTTEFGRAVRAQ